MDRDHRGRINFIVFVGELSLQVKAIEKTSTTAPSGQKKVKDKKNLKPFPSVRCVLTLLYPLV